MKLNMFRGLNAKKRNSKKIALWKKAAIFGLVLFLILSAIPMMSADSNVTITINFKDQNGDISSDSLRVYIDGFGYKKDGDTITVPEGKTIYYRGYYKMYSGLKGPKNFLLCDSDLTLDVMFRALKMDFEDQNGDLSPGDERVYMDYIGYKADDDPIIVPQDCTVRYRAYYKQYSGLKGPKLNELIDIEEELMVPFITFEINFPTGLPYTGDERIYIDYVGYKGNGDTVTVPKDSTIRYRMYYRQYSGLKSDKASILVEDENVVFNPTFIPMTVKLVDQNGALSDSTAKTGDEKVYIDYVGYKGDGEVVVVPHPATVRYRAYYKMYSGLKGDKIVANTVSPTMNLYVNFKTVKLNFIDQNDNPLTIPPATGDEKVYIYYIGYKENGDSIVVPAGSTLRYRAYYKMYSGLKGEKMTVNVDDLVTSCPNQCAGIWEFDEGSGDYAEDSSGNGHHGTINGATWTNGIIGSALEFDGVDDYVVIPDSTDFETQDLSVMAWVKSPDPGKFSYILAKGLQDLTAASYALYTYSNGGLAFYYYGGGDSIAPSSIAGPEIWDNEWHHVVGTYDGSSMRLFVDGSEIGTAKPVWGSIKYGLTPTDDLYIGTVGGIDMELVHFKGSIDEVRICPKALSEDEIKGLYQNPRADFCDLSLDVEYRMVTMKFIDQNNDPLTIPPATGNERVYIYYIGYKQDGAQILVPENCNLRYRAYYKMYSGLRGATETTIIEDGVEFVYVKFKIIEINIQDQNGDPAYATGDERVYINYIGYVPDGQELVVPVGSTIYYRPYYKQYSGLKSCVISKKEVSCEWEVLDVEYKTITLKFVDQNGNDIGTTQHRVYINYIGYKENGDVIMVPLGSKLYYRAYYKQYSGLKGHRLCKVVDCTWDVLEIEFKKIEINFKATSLTGNEKVYIDYVGYLSNGDELIVPVNSQIRYRAYYKQYSGLKGPKLYKTVDCSWEILDVEFKTITFRVEDGSGNLIENAQIYVDYVGYVDNDGEITVPLNSCVRFRAKVYISSRCHSSPSYKWSSKFCKKVDCTWTTVIIEWDGSDFDGPFYS